MKRLLTALTCLAIAPAAQAHDFWLLPATFSVEPTEPVSIGFIVGHGQEISDWKLGWDRIVSLNHYGPDGHRGIGETVIARIEETPGKSELSLDAPGTHMITFTSRDSWIELEAEIFNGHVEKEGLTLVANKREADGTTEEPGTELYSRRAKTLIQVGDVYTDQVTQPVGQLLEIVPDRNPYALGRDDALPVSVYFRGEPLEGATIDLENLSVADMAIQTMTTDSDGKASFKFGKAGTWKVNVIWSVPLENNERADFDTIFTSLTFGYN